MKRPTDYVAWMARIFAGLLLVVIGLQPVTGAHEHHRETFYPIFLMSTEVYALDILLRLLFVVFGVAIMLGIRSRLLAAFMLAVTLLQAAHCLVENAEVNFGHSMLFLLIAILSILIVRGGGIYAMRPEGWNNIPL
ncbi:hypothetical protein Z946_4072 [Sulfitobacter noctilucicola]|uniref:Putative membrane protein YphA (DoxX/SURF4 family) n=1 Tax=Sulfitobacter noctilucicola TaxID=1342301 RepID=A0A7W6Q417_9RHOB|nr:hypothetical protein [Sulfitobacter noctilucicola]KIN65172.1 hypothetical protein Z946_4072 [Sulfitobacter noctilucicola]MBB4173694.1 putative membrane protein YphA (DoxX/SURF4 family) [Sulfitobacter noctilucicola]